LKEIIKMREKVTLITGANGEIGHGLIRYLVKQNNDTGVVVLDIKGLDKPLRQLVNRTIIGDILDTDLLDTLNNEYEIDTIYHLAALLSTHSEFHPEAAHRVNVQGTINLLKLAIEQGTARGEAVKFIFPSSIAVYGVPLKENVTHPIREMDYLYPTTMYGANKLYCEHLGRYYSEHYHQLSETPYVGVDFRCIRFPGVISALTLPSGGTSDYAPEMVHAVAQGLPYESFVRPDTTIPFMVMPDAIRALIELANAPATALTQRVYNVTSFSASASEIASDIQAFFTDAKITYRPTPKRQGIVDTWPHRVDDSQARNDWGWKPEYDQHQAFNEYLFPTIQKLYTSS